MHWTWPGIHISSYMFLELQTQCILLCPFGLLSIPLLQTCPTVLLVTCFYSTGQWATWDRMLQISWHLCIPVVDMGIVSFNRKCMGLFGEICCHFIEIVSELKETLAYSQIIKKEAISWLLCCFLVCLLARVIRQYSGYIFIQGVLEYLEWNVQIPFYSSLFLLLSPSNCWQLYH